MNESWQSVFSARCSQQLTDADAKIWFMELRRSIPGWEHQPGVEGADPLMGLKAREINSELCSVIRWVMSQGDPQRADTGRKNAKYSVSDLLLWVRLYRKAGKLVKEGQNLDIQDQVLIRKMKPTLIEWAEAHRWDDIAIEVAMPGPKLINEAKLPNTSLSASGQAQLETCIITEYGMD